MIRLVKVIPEDKVCCFGSCHSEVSFPSINQGGLKAVFSDNLYPSVNTHPPDAGFHGINEAAPCADARERGPPFELLSFIATPPHQPPTPEIILAKPISFTTRHLLILTPNM